MIANPIYPGKVVMAFDSLAWNKNGGDSKTDNFMREATILQVYEKDDDGDVMVDLKFNYDGRISSGHFADSLQEVLRKH